MRTAGDFSPSEAAELKEAAKSSPLLHDELAKALDPKWFSAERFTYMGPYRRPFGCKPHLLLHLDAWVQRMVIPQILDLNRRRVQRAAPPPPNYNIEAIRSALWVLESEAKSKQGTAFALEGYGLVTNAHTLAEDTVAFRPEAPGKKYRTSVVVKHDTIDLAILATDAPLVATLRPGDSDAVKLWDHVLLAGFPNYRYGDSGIASPGQIIGFRPASAITRMLTNAGIVAGNSGGPVIGANGLVVGIAVTGAAHPSEVHKTENHGIIPVRALNFLNLSAGQH